MSDLINKAPNLDEDETKKEARRLAREEKRRQKEEALEQARSNRPQRKKLSAEEKKKIFIGCAIGISMVVLLLCIKPFINLIENMGREDIHKGLILLTDVTGYTEDDAIEQIREMGFVNIKREYIYDQYTQDGCVVKTDHHINSELKPDEQIIIFICDKSLIQLTGNNQEESPASQSADRTYFTMDNISVVDMAIKDNIFFAILKNNNSQAIKNIQYRIGYQDESGNDIGENKYKMNSDFMALPGEKFQISMEIRNNYANYLYVSGLTYEKIDVPEDERK